MSWKFIALASLATAHAAGPLIAREQCKPCSPQGASGTSPPAVGPSLSSLYVDVLGSVKNIHFSKRWEDSLIERADGFCCRETLDCVKLQNVNVPMCYDKFTTQYAFPDGSYGSLTTGLYNTKDGTQANLLTGDYNKTNGEKGNIYSQNPAAKPNTATMSIPPQWTASGVGSAIPATEIASVISAATTTPGQGATASGSKAEQTGTATAPQSAVSSKAGAAGRLELESRTSLGMSLFTAFFYAIYAL